MVQRRLSLELHPAFRRVWVPHAFMKEHPDLFPVGWDRAEERVQVRRRDDRDRRGVKVRGGRHTRQSSVTAVAAAHDADTLRIDDALVDKVFDAPRNIVLHLLAPFIVSRVQKLLSIAGRSTEIWQQDRVAAVRKELCKRVVTPIIPRPRAAMRNDNEWKVLFRKPLRKGQVGRYLETVRRFVPDRTHRGQGASIELFTDLIQACELLGISVKNPHR